MKTHTINASAEHHHANTQFLSNKACLYFSTSWAAETGNVHLYMTAIDLDALYPRGGRNDVRCHRAARTTRLVVSTVTIMASRFADAFLEEISAAMGDDVAIPALHHPSAASAPFCNFFPTKPLLQYDIIGLRDSDILTQRLGAAVFRHYFITGTYEALQEADVMTDRPDIHRTLDSIASKYIRLLESSVNGDTKDV